MCQNTQYSTSDEISAGEGKSYAIRKIVEGKNSHQELRTPGMSTHGSYAVLAATLGVVSGLAQTLQLNPQSDVSKDNLDGWRKHLSTNPQPDGLDMLNEAIQPQHLEALVLLSSDVSKNTDINKGKRPTMGLLRDCGEFGRLRGV